ncbi:outer membrane protein assembly factor BamE [Roseovarius spongiae]|uniref:Outer membrane protein assembly factor BamE n=1 Tax=Roseovarius spongiae TaxID=2320272 RepID=A0A3A8B6W0_9RHOB|nr:outer membrane protein assembly factor BamE [Roseovarius spongiae]RKF17075.1 outer membrane protein assembly factor BamE [Roseovarius spongiae]
MIGLKNMLRAACLVAGVGALTACTSVYRNHGYVPPQEDLSQLAVGVDSRATVDDVIGAPSAAGLLSDGDYYYVRSRIRHFGMKRPEVVERKVLAISFDGSDTIANIETFSLRDGNVVPLTRRVTDSSVAGKGFLKQMMDNFGNIDPSQLF